MNKKCDPYNLSKLTSEQLRVLDNKNISSFITDPRIKEAIHTENLKRLK